MFFLLNVISLIFRYCWNMSYSNHHFRAHFSCSMPLDDIGEKTTCKGFILSNIPLNQSNDSTKPDHPKKILMFLSGLMTCANEPYIQKAVHDLMDIYPELHNEYTVLVYENMHRTSLEVAVHIISFIEHYNSCLQTIEELNIVGFSAGGILASNVMANTSFLNDTCKRRIITYDTPMSVIHVMERFSQNWIYRFDFLYYYIVLNAYRTHVDNIRIRTILRNDQKGIHVYRGVDYALGQLKRIHGLTDKELVEKTGFNYVQPRLTEIHHLYFKEDPVIDVNFNIQYRNEQMRYLLENKPKITMLEKPGFEHCTDIWKNNHFAKYILGVLKSPPSIKLIKYYGKMK